MNSPVTSIHISIAAQRLSTFREKELLFSYPISTSKFGIGFERGSYQTPLGNFRISEKIGEACPLYTLFKERIPQGIWDQSPTEEDLILSRILWLEGVDQENRQTKERFIYIHGTNQEDLLGEPASWGCIRMKNRDVIELFDCVEIGLPVLITED